MLYPYVRKTGQFLNETAPLLIIQFELPYQKNILLMQNPKNTFENSNTAQVVSANSKADVLEPFSVLFS